MTKYHYLTPVKSGLKFTLIMRAFIAVALVAFILYVVFTCQPAKQDPVFIKRYGEVWLEPGNITLPAISKTMII